MAESPVETFCPECEGPVPVLASRCPYCGEVFETRRHRNGINGLVWVGVVSLLWLLPGAAVVVFGPPMPITSGNCMCSGGLYAFGLLLAAVGVVVGWFDLRGIRAGRLNPERRAGTLAGMWVCGSSLALYWCVIGYQIVRGL